MEAEVFPSADELDAQELLVEDTADLAVRSSESTAAQHVCCMQWLMLVCCRCCLCADQLLMGDAEQKIGDMETADLLGQQTDSQRLSLHTLSHHHRSLLLYSCL